VISGSRNFHRLPHFISALAGFANVLPFGKRKSARYAREIKSSSKEHHLSDIMASVQAANQQYHIVFAPKYRRERLFTIS
jgi:hypothetical protein